jgi:hypothetical protein
MKQCRYASGVILKASSWALESVDPAFWVNVAIALGTISAAIVALWLGLSAYRNDKARKAVESEAELRREAELQAVSVRFDTGRRRDPEQAGGIFETDVVVTNDSSRAIYDVWPWVLAGGAQYSETPLGRIGAGKSESFTISSPDPSDKAPASGSFVDSFGRKWSIDSGRALTLEGSYPMTATKAARTNLSKAAQ